jgi:transcriptional regulator with XRE-family HTH domain
MIKNDKQLKITSDWLREFEDAFAKLKADTNVNPLAKEMQLNAINSDIGKFQKEIREYENLKGGNTISLHIPELGLCYEALIKGRIAKGWSQAELAAKVGLKEQQIQRYEATNYSTASLPRIDEIVYALGINISLYVIGLSKHRFSIPQEYADKIGDLQKTANQKKVLLSLN